MSELNEYKVHLGSFEQYVYTFYAVSMKDLRQKVGSVKVWGDKFKKGRWYIQPMDPKYPNLDKYIVKYKGTQTPILIREIVDKKKMGISGII